MLERENAVLVVIDVQGALAQAMHEKEALFRELRRLIRGAQILDVPVLCTEQVPDRLGPTIPEVKELLGDDNPISKHTFSCCGNPAFNRALAQRGRRQVLLAGIESHICVYQTAAELVTSGFEVEVVTDAVGSRTAANRQIGLQKCRDAGAHMTSVETALFELQRAAGGDAFKALIGLVKELPIGLEGRPIEEEKLNKDVSSTPPPC